jgi:NADPH-dependent 2,4-dienoyl-CoA reductase/sulfur reductase-like enzyme
LCARGVEVHYLLRKDRYWGNVLDEHESRLVEARLVEEGIRIHYRSEIDRIVGKKNRVAGVVLSSGEKINCNMVGMAIGIKPRTQLAEGTGMEIDRGILVDETFKTSIEGIYAAGDVAQVWDPEVQQHVLDSLWWVAREQGRVAGRNMAGSKEVYQRRLPFNVTRIGGITTTLIGRLGQGEETDEDLVAIARGDSETWRSSADVAAIKKDEECNRVRLLVGERKIHGALVMGDQALSRPLQHLISEQVDIGSIRERLVNDPENLVELIVGFWSERDQQVHA